MSLGIFVDGEPAIFYTDQEMDRKIIAIDLGTSQCKTVAFNAKGNVLAESYKSYPTFSDNSNIFEQDPRDWWNAVTETLSEVSDKVLVKNKEELVGIGCCGHTPSLVLVDDKRKPIRPAITWQDRRANKQLKDIYDKVEKPSQVFGSSFPEACFSSLEQLLWVRRYEKKHFARVHKVLQPKDFINLRMTGVLATNFLSAKGFYNLYSKKLCTSLLESLDLPFSLLPEVYEPSEIIGYTLPEMENFGIPEGTPVIAGEMDSIASILGTLKGEKQVSNISGTSEIIGYVVKDKAQFDFEPKGFLTYPYIDGLQINLGVTKTGSKCIDWFISKFISSRGEYTEIDDLNVKMANYRSQSDKPPLIFLPYLEGERSPIWDRNVSGAFIGLKTDHNVEDLYLAVLEGVGYSVLDNLQLVCPDYASGGIGVAISGGGSRNFLLNQIKSDILGKELFCTTVDSSSALGVAMLVSLACNIYEDLPEAAQQMTDFKEIYYPQSERHKMYSKLFGLYRSFYSNNIDQFGKLHELS